MPVSEDHVEHHQVPSHPHHEDDHIQTYKDSLQPGLEDVQLVFRAARIVVVDRSGIEGVLNISCIQIHHNVCINNQYIQTTSKLNTKLKNDGDNAI